MSQWILVVLVTAYAGDGNEELSVTPSFGPTFSNVKTCREAVAAISSKFPSSPLLRKAEGAKPPRIFSQYDCVEIPR